VGTPIGEGGAVELGFLMYIVFRLSINGLVFSARKLMIVY
jgi:hypothetical protein